MCFPLVLLHFRYRLFSCRAAWPGERSGLHGRKKCKEFTDEKVFKKIPAALPEQGMS
jgi:hypothetical protein